MNKPNLGRKSKRPNLNYSNRKKHVETMFLTNKTKHYVYYYKNRQLFNTPEVNVVNLTPPFHSISVRILESGYLTLKPLKSIARFFKWFSKNYFLDPKIKLRLRVFPDFVLTSKPKEVRMGKGKGANLQKVAPVRAGQIIFTINTPPNENRSLLHRLMTKMSYKVPLKHEVIFNNW